MEEAPQQRSSGWVAFATGFTAVVVLVGALLVTGALFLAKRSSEAARRGWNMVPVPVAARTLRAGATISPGDIGVGQAPEQFVTASVARPQASALAGARLTTPLEKGDVVVHSVALPREGGRACVAAARAAAESSGDEVDREQQAFLSELERRLAPGDAAGDGGAP